MRKANRQHGVAMLLVMALVAVTVIIGMGFAYGASVKLASTTNMVAGARARYLAESGVQHALYMMRTDMAALAGSVGSPLGPYYADDTSDTYSFSVQQRPDAPWLYTVVATATSGGMTQTVHATVSYSAESQITVERSMMVGGGMVWLPNSVNIHGDFHVNGHLYNLARVYDDVTASGFIWDPYRLIRGSATPFTDSVELPTIDMDDYKQYAISGTPYQCLEHETNILDRRDPINGSGAISGDNIGGVVWLKPHRGTSVTIADNVHFEGTLMIDGNLILDGRNIKLDAMEGFPALIVTGTIYVTNRTNLDVRGIVRTGGGLVPLGSTRHASTDIRGGLIADRQGYSFSLRGSHTLRYEERYATLYDFSGQNVSATTVRLVDMD